MTEINHYKQLVEQSKIPLRPIITLEPEELQYLITTIESQNSQIESLKAITELAVKGLKKISMHGAVYRYAIVEGMADNVLSEIERLSQ